MLKNLNKGIDTLVIGYKIRKLKDQTLLQQLSDAKQMTNKTVFDSHQKEINIHGISFVVHAKGVQGYDYVLQNGDTLVNMARQFYSGKYYPEIRVSFRSNYLWRESPITAFNQVTKWIKSFAVIEDHIISRVDICSDLSMKIPEINLNKQLVTYARKKTIHYAKYHYGIKTTGYSFGIGRLNARIYDKIEELRQSNKDWFKPIWSKQGWQPGQPVTRIEFELTRDILRYCQPSIKNFKDLIKNIDNIWNYLTFKWLRIVPITGDSNRRRRPPIDYWKTAQDAFSKTYFKRPLSIVEDTNTKYNQLLKQSLGCIKTLCAIQTDILGQTHATLKVRRDLAMNIQTPEFQKDILERRSKIGVSFTPKNKVIDYAIRHLKAYKDNVKWYVKTPLLVSDGGLNKNNQYYLPDFIPPPPPVG